MDGDLLNISWTYHVYENPEKLSQLLSFALVGNPEIDRALGTFYFLWVFYFYFLFYSVGLTQAFIYETGEVGGKAKKGKFLKFSRQSSISAASCYSCLRVTAGASSL